MHASDMIVGRRYRLAHRDGDRFVIVTGHGPLLGTVRLREYTDGGAPKHPYELTLYPERFADHDIVEVG